ncbi:MAG: ABC transporter ATP-binding protein [Tannerella sp.]|jgi:ABC-2 type transport system ATP-binding protein|nr:ABC transporter ATP-binding protein [Tannerella sp.]
MQHPVIEINNLHKTYKRASHPSVDGLSLRIEEGMFFGFLGPNGAGKTTTISILCGLSSFQRGEIIICGMDLRRKFPQIKPHIGVAPQDIALYPELTIDENLRFVGNVYELPAQLLKQQINYYLESFGLTSHRQKKVAYLSGGMKRQVNLIAALLHKPKILFLDEPTVGVDVKSRQIIVRNLQLLNQNGMTIVYTSHDMHEAESLCTYVSLVNKGKVICEGTPSQLIEKEQVNSLEALFILKTGIKPI